MFFVFSNILKKISYFLVFFIFFSAILKAAPVVNLKGSLSVNQGALNYSVALDLPVGVAGVAPKISLDYNSNAGNGLLGQGWSIGGLSSITRCGSSIADDGFNRAVQLDAKDNFCMDGQKLVHKTGKEFRTQIESYSKIVYTGSRTNPSKFTVWLKSGDIYEYAESETVSSENITWYLSKINDRYGNSISFNYVTHQYNTAIISSITYDGNNEIIFSYSTRKDKFSGYRFGQVYKNEYKLDNIKIKSAGVEVKKYELSYQVQSDSFDKLKLGNIKKCINSSCSQPLTFSWQENNEEVSFASNYTFPDINIKKGDVKLLDLNNDGFTDIYQIKENEKDIVWINDKNGNFTKKYYIDSKEKNKNYQFFDYDNDGYVDIFVSGDKERYFWKNNRAGNFSKTGVIIANKNKKIYFLDFNSDNYTDVFMTGMPNPLGELWSNTSKTFVETGAFNFPESPWITKWAKDYGGNSFIYAYDGGTSFADINQDGKMDVLVNINLHAKQPVGNGNVNNFYRAIGLVFLNNGTGFTYNNEIDYGSKHTSKLYLDINGDRVTDIIDSTNGIIYLSDSSLSWKKKSLGFSTNVNNLKFIDFNHDGSLDILHIKNSEENLYLNNGRGDFKSYLTLNLNVVAKDIKFADFNSDGFIDIYVVKKGADDIWLNNGLGNFVLSSEHPNIEVTAELLEFADINGDGLTDIIPLQKNSDIYINQLKRPLLTSVTDSFLNITEIKYDLLTNDNIYKNIPTAFHMNKSNSNFKITAKYATALGDTTSGGATTVIGEGVSVTVDYGTMILSDLGENEDGTSVYVDNNKYIFVQNSTMVVSAVTSFKNSSIENTLNYKYEGLKYEMKHNTLSFNQILTEDTLYKKKVVNNYYQNFPMLGMLRESRTFLNEEKESIQLNRVNFQEESGVYVIYTNSTNSVFFENGNIVKNTENLYKNFNDYGNANEIITQVTNDEESFKTVTLNTYNNDTSNWILGRVKTASVTHEGWGHTKVRKSAFTYNNEGSVESETIEQGNALELTTTYVYDDYGNRETKTISSPSLVESRTTTYDYSEDGKNLLKITNPLGHTNQADNQYNSLGQIISTTTANGLTTRYEYDAWGKKTKETRADGTTTSYNYKFDSSVSDSKYSITIKSTGSPDTISYYDNFDRLVKVKSKRFDGEDVFVDTFYNEKSEVIKKSLPYTNAEIPSYMEYEYDEYGRMLQTTKPSPQGGDAIESVEYNGLSVTTFDAKGHQKTTTKNVLGQTIKIEEEEGAYVKYYYDAIGNLVKTKPNHDTMQILMTYDILGNKRSMKDPDMGYWEYEYNALGQLIYQKDAKLQETRITYDKLGRKTKEVSPDGTSTWSYDQAANAKGKLYQESNGKLTKTYSYDSIGRASTVETKIDNKTFNQSYAYNSQGKLASTTQPNGFKLINTYNAQGYLESIKSPAEQIKDFDRDHFADLLEKSMASGLDFYKKSLEFQDKANKLRSKANYYASIAKRYAAYEKRYHDYAKRLRSYAKHYEYYGNKYASYSKRYRSYANSYYSKANYYHKKGWFGKWVSSYFRRIANRYSYYADRYAYYSRHYLNKAKNYERWAVIYDDYGSHFGKVEDYYLQKSKQLYAEANDLEVKAKEYERFSKNAGGGENSEEVSQAYKEILSDTKHVYHYKVLAHNRLGKVSTYLSGNGLVTEDTYDETGAMNSSKTGYTFDASIRDLQYTYDHNYNVTSRSDKKLNISQEFEYDKLDRIVSTRVNSTKYGFSNNVYEYNVYGNLTSKDGKRLTYHDYTHKIESVENPQDDFFDYYEITEDPVEADAEAIRDSKYYYYDKNGNMTINCEATIEYNAHNKVTKLKENGKNITFAYDMNQKRYHKSEGVNDTYYLGKSYEYQTHTNGSNTHKYMIYANGKVVTVHSEKAEVQETGEELKFHETRYLHYDSLGSVDAITNQQGTVVQRTAYKPFGEQLDVKKLSKSKQVTNRGFTGHEHIEGTKFIHMNARLYDPTIGRFLSADTYIQAPYDTQSYNRYSYVKNNPLKYTDPTGHFWGIGGRIKRQLNRSRYDILGGIATVAGAALLFTPFAPIGVALMTGGMSTMSYDPNQPTSLNNQISFSTSYSYNTSWGQGNGLTAGQRYSVNQGRADTNRLQGYIDNLGVYRGSGSGDLELREDGKLHYVMNRISFIESRYRQIGIDFTITLMVDKNSGLSSTLRSNLKKYQTNYFISYIHTPYLNLRDNPKDIYNGAHRTEDNIYGGRGIHITDAMYSGYGESSSSYYRLMVHEINHHIIGASSSTGVHPTGFYYNTHMETINFLRKTWIPTFNRSGTRVVPSAMYRWNYSDSLYLGGKK